MITYKNNNNNKNKINNSNICSNMDNNNINVYNIWNEVPFKNQEFKIPHIKCPWEFKMNENLHVKEKHIEWLKTFLTEKQISKIGDTFIAYIYTAPFAGPDELLCISRYCDLGFILDDEYFEKGLKGLDYIDEIYHSKNPNNCKYIEKKNEVYDDFLKIGANKECVDLFDTFLEYSQKIAIKLANGEITINSNTSFDEYLNIRIHDIGAEFYIAILTTTLPISNEIRETKQFKKLIKHFCISFVIVNDVYSFKKENNLDSFLNYIKLKAIQCGSIQESFNFARDKIEESFNKMDKYFNYFKNQYQNDNNSNLHEYLKHLKYLASGHLAMYPHILRYNLKEKTIK